MKGQCLVGKLMGNCALHCSLDRASATGGGIFKLLESVGPLTPGWPASWTSRAWIDESEPFSLCRAVVRMNMPTSGGGVEIPAFLRKRRTRR